MIINTLYHPWNEQVKDFKGYNGSTLIKAVGVQTEWLPEMLMEMAKCRRDPVYFIETYMKIEVKGKGLQPFKLYPYQRVMIDNLKNHRFNIFATARQAGKSTVVSGFVLWYLIFNVNRPLVAFVANKGETAVEILGKVKVAFENLPLWIQPNVVKWNDASITLENGSRAVAKPTTSDSLRGLSIDMLFVDEAAFIENWDTFWPSTYNTISSTDSTKAVLVSTPKGLNHFFEEWERANNPDPNIRDNFVPIKVIWSDVPGRDEEWRKTTLSKLGNDLHMFNQEHCVEFLGSSATLISGTKLKALVKREPRMMMDNGLKQYEKPQHKHRYVMVVDTAEGKGLDYSAFQVIDVTKLPFKQVCAFRSNTLTPVEYADVVFNIGKHYFDASILVELNSIGGQVCQILNDEYEYDNLIWTQGSGPNKKSQEGFTKAAELGIRTTKQVKAYGCSHLKMLVEQDQLILNDANTIEELKQFIRVKNSYEADKGKTDDLVMCLVLFAWYSDQPSFKDEMGLNTTKNLRDKSEAQTIDELALFATFLDPPKTVLSNRILGKNHEGWVLDNDPTKKVRIYF